MEDKLDIRHIKMINGDEILALINQNNPDNYLVERPVLVNQNMLGNYSLTPWFPFTKSSLFKIFKNRVIASTRIDESVQQNYINFVLSKDQPEVQIQSDSELIDKYRDMLMNRHTEEDEYYEEPELESKPETIH
tara:strand:+ start:2544 stop:2945 length:402 start_codon:yes stop_codon:yes gene_type:complete